MRLTYVPASAFGPRRGLMYAMQTIKDFRVIETQAAVPDQPSILHVCRREMLRPLRDEILRISGFRVDSTLKSTEAMPMFAARHYDLVLVDVEGQGGIPDAEHLCAEVKTANPNQLVAFTCNWRVAALTDCPDDIVRSEFDPAAFVAGVRKVLEARA